MSEVLSLRAAGVQLVLDVSGPALPRVLHWGRDLGPGPSATGPAGDAVWRRSGGSPSPAQRPRPARGAHPAARRGARLVRHAGLRRPSIGHRRLALWSGVDVACGRWTIIGRRLGHGDATGAGGSLALAMTAHPGRRTASCAWPSSVTNLADDGPAPATDAPARGVRRRRSAGPAAVAAAGHRGARPDRPLVPRALAAAADLGHGTHLRASPPRPDRARRDAADGRRHARLHAPGAARSGPRTSRGAATTSTWSSGCPRGPGMHAGVIGGGELLRPGEMRLGARRDLRRARRVLRLVRRRARRPRRRGCTSTCARVPPTRAPRARWCSTPGRRSTSTSTWTGCARSRRRPPTSASSGSSSTTAGSAAGATTPPAWGTGTSTSSGSRTDCTRSWTTCGHWACSSGCGSSRRWSTWTPTWSARIPTGCSTSPRRPGDRSAPDWRGQHVLDVAQPEVSAYLLERLDALVTEYAVDFLKWDHNRDLHAAQHLDRTAAAYGGCRACTPQTAAVYALLDELRRRHPGLEIESCSSGGARVDLGILARTDRVWASDSQRRDRAPADPVLDGQPAAAGAGRLARRRPALAHHRPRARPAVPRWPRRCSAMPASSGT